MHLKVLPVQLVSYSFCVKLKAKAEEEKERIRKVNSIYCDNVVVCSFYDAECVVPSAQQVQRFLQ